MISGRILPITITLYLLVIGSGSLQAKSWDGKEFLASQQENYKKEKWSRFFGKAFWYRQFQLEKDFVPDILLLEGMAYLRHCQFEGVRYTTHLLRRNRKNVTGKARIALERKIQQFEELYFFQTLLPEQIETDPKGIDSSFFSTTKWEVPKEKQKEFARRFRDRPDQIQMRVKDKCKDPIQPRLANLHYPSDFTIGLKELLTGKTENAFSLFDRAHGKQGQNIFRKSFSALMLTYGSNDLTEKETYAKYYLNNPLFTLSPNDQVHLRRILGDAAYRNGKMQEAEEHYAFLHQSESAEAKEYGAYHLAWLEMAQSRSAKAVAILAEEVKKKGPLNELLIKDLGQALVEDRSKNSARAAAWDVLANASTKDASQATEGIIEGFKRLNLPEEYASIPAELPSLFADPVLSRLLRENLFQNSCDVLPWVPTLEIKDTKQHDMEKRILTCLASQPEKAKLEELIEREQKATWQNSDLSKIYQSELAKVNNPERLAALAGKLNSHCNPKSLAPMIVAGSLLKAGKAKSAFTLQARCMPRPIAGNLTVHADWLPILQARLLSLTSQGQDNDALRLLESEFAERSEDPNIHKLFLSFVAEAAKTNQGLARHALDYFLKLNSNLLRQAEADISFQLTQTLQMESSASKKQLFSRTSKKNRDLYLKDSTLALLNGNLQVSELPEEARPLGAALIAHEGFNAAEALRLIKGKQAYRFLRDDLRRLQGFENRARKAKFAPQSSKEALFAKVEQSLKQAKYLERRHGRSTWTHAKFANHSLQLIQNIYSGAIEALKASPVSQEDNEIAALRSHLEDRLATLNSELQQGSGGRTL